MLPSGNASAMVKCGCYRSASCCQLLRHGPLPKALRNVFVDIRNLHDFKIFNFLLFFLCIVLSFGFLFIIFDYSLFDDWAQACIQVEATSSILVNLKPWSWFGVIWLHIHVTLLFGKHFGWLTSRVELVRGWPSNLERTLARGEDNLRLIFQQRLGVSKLVDVLALVPVELWVCNWGSFMYSSIQHVFDFDDGLGWLDYILFDFITCLHLFDVITRLLLL